MPRTNSRVLSKDESSTTSVAGSSWREKWKDITSAIAIAVAQTASNMVQNKGKKKTPRVGGGARLGRKILEFARLRVSIESVWLPLTG